MKERVLLVLGCAVLAFLIYDQFQNPRDDEETFTTCISENYYNELNLGTEETFATYISENYYNKLDLGTVEEASAILYCYADEYSGEEISRSQLREAIWVMLEYYDDTLSYLNKIDSKNFIEEYHDFNQ